MPNACGPNMDDASDVQVLALYMQVMEWLSKEAQVRLANACQALLQKRLAPAIEKDVELLSDSGRDRMFNSASSIFLRLPKIIAAHLEDGEQLAFRMVCSAAGPRCGTSRQCSARQSCSPLTTLSSIQAAQPVVRIVLYCTA